MVVASPFLLTRLSHSWSKGKTGLEQQISWLHLDTYHDLAHGVMGGSNQGEISELLQASE